MYQEKNVSAEIPSCNAKDFKQPPFNDERLYLLQKMVTELKLLNIELNKMIFLKCDALLGCLPHSPTEDSEKAPVPEGWVDETMHEVQAGIISCQSSLERLAQV